MIRRWLLTFWSILAIIAYLVLVARYFTIQVLNSNEYRKRAESQSQGIVEVPAKRGIIYDRNFNQLAIDVEQYSFGVNPKYVKNPKKLAQIFTNITDNSIDHYLKLFKRDRFLWLGRGIDLQTANKIKLSPDNSVVKEKTIGRYYPYQRTASHILGFTNIDHKGLAGIEKSYDEILQGEKGFKTINFDGKGRSVPTLGKPELEPVNGKNVILTIDINYQRIVEEELKRGIEKYKAKAGMLVLMNPFTGEVLSLACYPNFNPNSFPSFQPYERRNRVVVDPYEPGSTYKLVTVSAALEKGIYKPTDIIFCENGKSKFPGGWITDHKPYGNLSFKKVYSNSSNIGIAKISQKVGKKWIYEYSRSFGFGGVTGVDLMGEDQGKLTKYVKWSNSDAVRVSIGYGVMATSIQMTNAYATVANGGYLLKPRLIKAIQESNHPRDLQETKIDTIRQVLKLETVAVLKSFMRDVVENGTGKKAAIEGIDIAGKTGTTKKFNSETNRYSDTKYIASFVGFAPVEHPKLVCLVMLDEPKYPYIYGGQSSAPIFSRILRRILGLMSDDSDAVLVENTKSKIMVPDITELSTDIATSILQDYGFETRIEGEGNYVLSQYPAPNTLMLSGELVKLNLGNKKRLDDSNKRMPDVRGKSLREAALILTQAGFNPLVIGSGIVVSQSPTANSKTNKIECKIICRPKSG
ncbi:PASTA domain-containing protein [candidate division KSB1 bacterium]|nr:PASTA domain-containing protein [candidate division KSB1 bacterium]